MASLSQLVGQADSLRPIGNPMPLVFSITGRSAKIVGRTPRSAAGSLAGLPAWMRLISRRRAGPGGPARTRGSAPQFLQNSQNSKNEWHWIGNRPLAALAACPTEQQSRSQIWLRTADAGRRNRAVRRVRKSAGCQPARRFSTCPTRHSSRQNCGVFRRHA